MLLNLKNKMVFSSFHKEKKPASRWIPWMPSLTLVIPIDFANKHFDVPVWKIEIHSGSPISSFKEIEVVFVTLSKMSCGSVYEWMKYFICIVPAGNKRFMVYGRMLKWEGWGKSERGKSVGQSYRCI